MTRRLLGALGVLCLVLVAACRSWDAEYAARLDAGFGSRDSGTGGGGAFSDGGGGASLTGGGRSGGGGGLATGGGLSGRADASTDGGVDAGCRPLCFVRSFVSGELMRDFTPVSDGGFLGFTFRYYSDFSTNIQMVLLDAAGQRTFELPVASNYFLTARAIGGTREDFILATRVGLFRYADGGALAGNDCGFSSGLRSWYSISYLSPDEAWAGEGQGKLCHWTRAGGFQPDSTLVDAGVDSIIRGLVAFPSEIFVAGSKGLLGRVAPQQPPELARAPNEPTFFDLHGLSGNDVWAVGSDGVGFRWRDAGWTELPQAPIGATVGQSLDTPALWSVWVAADEDVWTVGTGGTVQRWQNGAWLPVLLPNLQGNASEYHFATVSSHGTRDLLIGGEHDLSDGGVEGFVWLYRRD